MQRIFLAEGYWSTPWVDRGLPAVTQLATRHPEQTVFTRFITSARAENMPGVWCHLGRSIVSSTTAGWTSTLPIVST